MEKAKEKDLAEKGTKEETAKVMEKQEERTSGRTGLKEIAMLAGSTDIALQIAAEENRTAKIKDFQKVKEKAEDSKAKETQ